MSSEADERRSEAHEVWPRQFNAYAFTISGNYLLLLFILFSDIQSRFTNQGEFAWHTL